MRPIVTDGVARSVGLFVGQSVTVVSPAKKAESIKLLFGLRTWVGPGTMYQMGVQIPMGRGNLKGKGVARCKV